MLSKTEKTKQEKLNVYEALNEAKNTNTKIQKMVSQVEDPELSNNISEIHTTVSKIIETVEKKPDKYKKMNNFFGYYLPVTINILTKYDEIENQKLNTEDSKKIMESTQKMVKKINEAFKKQLSNLYQSDMIDT
ncbi:MAG: 5-bromo-4-chloroindolyl phosphate hydrolysis family protein, partial [Clostridiales bacterium]